METGSVAVALQANSIGIPYEMIFFDTNGKTLEELAAVFGKCRYVLSSVEEIDALNSAAKDLVLPGRLETIAIRVVPEEESASENALGIPEARIPELSAVLRKAEHIAVKGVFVRPASSKNVSAEMVKRYFSLVKDFRSYLPCTLSYFCFESLLKSLPGIEGKALSDCLGMIRSLNDTSLYAQFLIS
ncbi:MAG: hypothetical protein VB064_03020 [Oscillospiraceae bacterium]|nr:hypothetical protein [Oscillospiraceae bacterium]